MAVASTRPSTLTTLLVHLRLPFQLLLAPVFLWGWLLAGGRVDPMFGVAFVAFHVCLYGGTTGFNSYYDRDEGPIGGLEYPPPVVEALLPFSLALKTVGLIVAAMVGWAFALPYAAFFAFSVAYSHPAVRLKAKPFVSLMTVAFFQGAVAFWAAWGAARGELASALTPPALLGATIAVLFIAGLYPITQVYQIAEDRARGDCTIAVAWGPARCFALAFALQSLGALLLAGSVLDRYGVVDALVVVAGMLVQLALLARFARRFDPSRTHENYRTVMRMNCFAASALGGYLLFHLLIR